MSKEAAIKQLKCIKPIMQESVPEWRYKVGKQISLASASVNTLVCAPERASKERIETLIYACKVSLDERIKELQEFQKTLL